MSKSYWLLALWILAASLMLNQVSGVPVASANAVVPSDARSTFEILRDWVSDDGPGGKPSEPSLLSLGTWVLDSMTSTAAVNPDDYPIQPATAVGTLPGNFSVDRFGNANYSVPLAVPPGANGMQPELALTYSSGRGMGMVGMGFALSGLSSIVRCPKNLALDGENANVQLSQDDALCLDGQRLVHVGGGTYGSAGSEYRTRRDTFRKIVSNGGINDQFSSFTVYTKGGRILTYGGSLESRLHAWPDVNYQWSLSRIEDRFGNYMTIDYATEPGDAWVPTEHPDLEGEVDDFFYAGTTAQRPTEIRYTGNGAKTPQRWVEFRYDNLEDANQHLDGWKGGGRIHHVVKHLLTDIVMHGADGAVVRAYRLGYTDGPTTNRPRLEALELCDGDGVGAVCLPPTTFEWEPGQTGYDVASDTAFSGLDYLEAHPAWEANCNYGPRPPLYQLMLDVDADGSQDFLIARGQYDIGDNPPNLVGLDNPCNREFYWQIWPTRLGDAEPGDSPWNGQGFEEISTGIGVQTREKPHVINYDGDFRDDIIFMEDGGGDYSPTLRVMESIPVEPGEDPRYGGPWALGPSGATDESMHIRDFQTLDLNGDGFQDLMICRGAPEDDYGYWYYVLHSGVTGDYSTNGYPLDGLGTPLNLECIGGPTIAEVMDYDGDRNQELLVVPEVEDGQIIRRDDRSPQYHAVELDLVGGEISDLLPTGLPSTARSFADVNGDGLQDGLTVDETGTGVYDESVFDDCTEYSSWCRGIRTWENVGGRFVSGELLYERELYANPGNHKTIFLSTHHDRNSDGRVDIAFGTVERTDTTITTRRNLIESHPGAPILHRNTLAANTSTLGFNEQTEEEIIPTELPHSIVPIGDVNGDGLHDLAYVGIQIIRGEVIQRTWTIYVHQGKQPDMLTKVTNGYGAEIGITYQFTRQKEPQFVAAYDIATQCSNPEICHTGPRQVVARYVEDTDSVRAGDLRVHQFQYEDGRTKRGLGWLGFKVVREVEVIDYEIRSIHERAYDLDTFSEELQAFPFADIATRELLEVPLVDEDGNVRVHVTRIVRAPQLWEERPQLGPGTTAASGPYFPVVTSSTTEEFEITSGCTGLVTAEMGTVDPEVEFCTNKDLTFRTPFRSATTETYVDEYGTMTDQTVTYSDGHETDIESRNITNDPDQWLLGLVGEQTVRDTTPVVDGALDQKKRTWLAYYDEETGALRRRVVEPGNQDLMVDTEFIRDVHGNVERETSLDGWGQLRLDRYNYDDEGVFPIEHFNGLFHLTTTQWRRGLGVPFAVTDPNGVSQVTVHDSFGRVVAEERLDPAGNSDGARVDHDYQPIPGINVGDLPRLRNVTTVAGGEETLVEYDEWGRELYTSTTGYFGQNVGTRIYYDDRGNVSEVAELDDDGNTVTSTTTIHDNLGRPTTIQTGDGRVTSFEYEGLITREINPIGTVTETEVDGRDRVVRVYRKGGFGEIREDVVCYVYDAFGSVRRVKKAPARFTPGGCIEEWPGNTVEYESDAYGHQLVVDDLAMGIQEYRYDGFGNVKWSRDGKGQETSFDYDALGRRTRRVDADGTTLWTYDSFVGAFNQSWSPDGHSVEQVHDQFGRLVTTFHTVEGRTYPIRRVYDEYSRLYWLKYPSSQTQYNAAFWVRYNFDDFGHVVEVREKTYYAEPLYWQILDVDHRSRVTNEKYRGGTTTEREIDPHTGATTSIVHRDKNGGPIQRLNYDYDDNLNLKTRSEQFQFFYQEENFRYDALDRVENATAEAGTQQRSVDVRYNYVGDIAQLGGMSYSYDGDNGRLEAAGNFEFLYDANGNTIQRQINAGGFPPPPTEFSYNAQNMLRDVTTTSDFLEYEYDADRNRVLRRSASEDETTYYIGNLMEETWEDGASRPSRRYKVHADGRVVIQVSEAPATRSPLRTRYALHPDHLGSTTLVTDEQGSEVQRMYYDMWGAKRGDDWTSPATYQNPVGINVGFTGHEEQIDGGLMNMRGRMYDPKLGRFMSPDPIVARPETLQGWNRYAYVENNPLTRVDPSGHIWLEQMLSSIGGWFAGYGVGGGSSCAVNLTSGCTTLGETRRISVDQPPGYQPDYSSGFMSWLSGLGQEQGSPFVNLSSNASNSGGYFMSGLSHAWGDAKRNMAMAGHSLIEGLRPDEVDIAFMMAGAGLTAAAIEAGGGYGMAIGSVGGPVGMAMGGAAGVAVAYLGVKLATSKTGRKFLEKAGKLFGGKAAKAELSEGTRVYRVWGDGAAAQGRSWTTVNPNKVGDFRDAAGLPTQNSGRFVSEGMIKDARGIEMKAADPLHGNRGGLPEVLIPNPGEQVDLLRVSGANPPF